MDRVCAGHGCNGCGRGAVIQESVRSLRSWRYLNDGHVLNQLGVSDRKAFGRTDRRISRIG